MYSSVFHAFKYELSFLFYLIFFITTNSPSFSS